METTCKNKKKLEDEGKEEKAISNKNPRFNVD
jgi:hypothetical protein